MLPRDYDAQWATEFAEIRDVLWPRLEPNLVEIHHVGSTAIPGMFAKPILDIDIEISDCSIFEKITEALKSLGYQYEGDLGIPDRHAFRKISPLVPYTGPARIWMEQHVYVCPATSTELRRHLHFRDRLRSDEELRVRYRKLKEDCLEHCDGSRKVYQSLREANGAAFFAEVPSTIMPRK